MKFEISRDNGKSDAEVLVEFAAKREPGELITYAEFAEALGEGAERAYSLREVQSAVCRTERKLATEKQRALINVRGQGYRIALAGEHQMIAGRKKDRAGVLLKRGLTVLHHVDWASMDDNTRKAHEGQMMVVGALCNAMSGIDARLRAVEDVIKNRNKGDGAAG